MPPVTTLPVTDLASSHQLAMALWRGSLAMGWCSSASLVGHGQAPGDRVPWNAGSMSTVTDSQVGPAGSASLRDLYGTPAGPVEGLWLGLTWRWSWREKEN